MSSASAVSFDGEGCGDRSGPVRNFGDRGEGVRGNGHDALGTAPASLVPDESLAGVVGGVGGPGVCDVFCIHASIVM